jgi:hypothetical protein
VMATPVHVTLYKEIDKPESYRMDHDDDTYIGSKRAGQELFKQVTLVNYCNVTSRNNDNRSL